MYGISTMVDGVTDGNFAGFSRIVDGFGGGALLDGSIGTAVVQHAEVTACMCEACTKARLDDDDLLPVEVAEDAPGNTSSTDPVVFGGSVAGAIDTGGDQDWYRVTLTAGQTYTFWTNGAQTPTDTLLRLRDASGGVIVTNDDGGQGALSHITFTATTTGTYFVDVSGFSSSVTGSYSLFASNGLWNAADTVADNRTTTGTVAFGGTTTVTLNGLGDHDWYRVTLTAGTRYVFQTSGQGTVDTYLILRDSNGGALGENDDGGGGTYSRLVFTPTTSGTYYIDVGAWREQDQGTFTLSFGEAPPLTVWTNDQIANQLTNLYWTTPHHFNVAPGGTLTVDITGLTAAGQTLARAALQLWTDFTGINFVEQTGNAQITFDDNQEGAFANASYNSAGVTSSATVNVGTAWLTTYGTGINSYSFQTYVHEIGHALGLGHGGPYNSSADYATDASYLNDAWITTVMSYFDALENSYFAGLGYTRQFTLSPMAADAIAVANMYGTVTTTRTGNTTYGYNSNAGRDIYNAALYPNVAYTIIDNGGIDTLDYSGNISNQLINLREEAFSNIGLGRGNVVIARGSVIENAIGGSGNDFIIGNNADNILDGRGGADGLHGGLGNDTYYVDRLDDIVFEFAGEGTDTVISTSNYYLWQQIENLTLAEGAGDIFGVGNEIANTLQGNSGANLLIGGAGDDIVRGGAGNDSLFGESGVDQLFGDAGIDYLVGGIGNDTLNGGTDADALYGEDGDDILIGGSDFATDILVGGAGNDILRGDSGLGDYDRMDGGSGDDSYYVDTPNDLTFEAVGGGTDTVYATISGAGYYLNANVENLVLGGNTPFGVGNELNNRITGSASANWLLGGAGNDILNGGAGNDVLFGEAGADTFVFTRGTGGDVIADFVVGTDRIDISAYGLTWQTVINSMHENGGTTAIDLGNGDFIVINGVARASLSQSDFILSTPAEDKVPVMEGLNRDQFADLLGVDHAVARDSGMSAWEQPHAGWYLIA